MDKSEMLSMSDEDFMKLDSAPPVESTTEVVEPVVEQATVTTVVAETTQQPQTEENTQVEQTQVETQNNDQPQLTAEEQAAADAAKGQVVTEEEAPVDYKVLYEGLVKPIKANGKDIELRSPEELRQLAQMGANYTRKMQAIAPHRKTLLMLENNGLLDEKKLNFLIDLSRKDPTAIQQFLRESGVDPMDIDVNADPTYKGGNHSVSDAEVNFRTALDDARTSTEGQFILQAIDGTWDQASKELLFKQPGIIEVMTQQHETGVYSRIVDEMDRQRTLGALPTGQTWLESYKAVGDQMVAAGQFADLIANEQQQQQNVPPVAPTPVASRVIAPKPTVAPNAKATAAAPSRAAPASAKVIVNPLQLSDDDFLKQFADRL